MVEPQSLEIVGLTLKASSAPADLAIEPGKINVVLGRNHAGKTALARLIAGLPTTAHGDVVLNDHRLDAIPIRRRPVAMVYQTFVNYPHWTVFDNIASPLRAQQNSGRLNARVSELANSVGLGELLTRKPHELSGGQQQRLAIARALAKSPAVLVMDEPLVNLDYKLREALEIELRSLLASAGITVIYTTSDPRDAIGLGDNVILLDDHDVLQTGAPLDVYRHPVSLAAANLMSDPGINRLDERRAVRPEHVSLHSRDGDGVSRYRATVIGTETNGTETYIHAQVDHNEWVIKTTGITRVPNGDLTLFVDTDDIIEVRA